MPEHVYSAGNRPRWKILLSVARELGFRQIALYGVYQLGLRSGFYRRLLTPSKASRVAKGVKPDSVHPLWCLPEATEISSVLGETGRVQLLAEADEIAAGQVRLFGGPPVPLQLAVREAQCHWTAYESCESAGGASPESDIKWIWEVGRLGWAYTLGRGYLLSHDERYAAAFWNYIESFLEANPPYLGPQWASGQEVALRLIALTFCWQVFREAECSTPSRKRRLAQAVAIHAARIPPTLVYARAQNNNHLLSEAAGLHTAGLFLPDHPQARRWRSLGWRWFNRAIQAQVAPDGAYVQNSTNYHRLMLQIALWVCFLTQTQGQVLPGKTQEQLKAATRWLMRLLDPLSGAVPNLGPNDGAYILPLAVCPQEDYRPVLQAAAAAFLGERPFVSGPWDEMGLWLVAAQPEGGKHSPSTAPQPGSIVTPHVLRSADGSSWAYLRAACFTSRPGHADQLHLDLWWRGLNVAQDAGTYLYNASPPWENTLACSQVHNTVVIDGQDQMLRAGRFLYINRAQAEVWQHESWEEGGLRFASARHDGYRRIGVWHQRQVAAGDKGVWEVKDLIYPMQSSGSPSLNTASLHWLLPDWPWEVLAQEEDTRFEITLSSPSGPIRLLLELDPAVDHHLSQKLLISRAGERIWGDGEVLPFWGWTSPTYAVRIPALSIRLTQTGSLPLGFNSRFAFPLDLEHAGQ